MQGEGNFVIVTDIRMPFWSIVIFMVKAAIASIPAMIILFSIVFLLMIPFAALFAFMNG